MSLTYSTYVQAVQNELNIPTDNADTSFQNIVPRGIEYAELRIYRDMDFLATLGSQTATLTASNRNVALPPSIVVCQDVNVITPVSATIPDNGIRNPLTRVSIEFLNAIYTSSANPTIPQYYALIGTPTTAGSIISVGTYNIQLGPFPDQAYTAEVIGTVRPSPLSQTNPATFLSTYLPDLFLAASLVFFFGWQRDFGAQSDNPQTAQSWENQYATLKAGVNIEEIRKKAASVSWSPFIPTPQANIPRDHAPSQA